MKPFRSLGYQGQISRLSTLAQAALRDYDVDSTALALIAHRENTTFRVVDGAGQRYLLPVHRLIDGPWNPP